jgi:hypothetical protein
VARLKDRRKPVADSRDSQIGGRIAGIQEKRCLCGGRFLGEFSLNTWVMLPRIDAPSVNLNVRGIHHRAGVDRGLTSSYSRAG